tara:strand:+ start:404 stop:700 length:297 start_codon:yes stop_codon:yes gene_type:complete
MVEDQKYQDLEQQVVEGVVEQPLLVVMDLVILEHPEVQEYQIIFQEQQQLTLAVVVDLVKAQVEVVDLEELVVEELDPQLEEQLEHLELLILAVAVEE